MLSIKSVSAFDVPGVICWVFADRFSPVDPTEHTDPKVNIHGPVSSKIGPPGLKERFWDSAPGNEWTDQTHHFGGFFSFGASFGMDIHKLHLALSGTSDWSIAKQEIVNQGDYDLGIMAARWGDSWSKNPRFIGKLVEQELTP